MLLKKLIYLFCILLLMVSGTCHSVHNSARSNVPDPVVTYPSTQIDLPGIHFEFYPSCIILAGFNKDTLPFFDISKDFCLFDKNHIASEDPKLFTDGDMMLINLSLLKKYDYSFPLPKAKVISTYAGKRKYHSGIDLKTFAKDTIRSAFDGIVRMAKEYAAYGNVIVVRHFNGLETVYSHNFKHLVKQGDKVIAGQPVALVGRTGRATTDHLHFEVRINGQHFNPELLFDIETQTLKEKTLYCVKKGSKIKVAVVDPFPYLL